MAESSLSWKVQISYLSAKVDKLTAERDTAREEIGLLHQAIDAQRELRRSAEQMALRLFETVRRHEPVIEAAKAWASPKGSTVEIDNAGNALEDAVAALDDAPDPDEFQPMFGTITEEDARLVARATGGGIRSADLKVEFEETTDGP